MSENIFSVEQAFDPDLRHAQEEFDAYLASRPYQDVNGRLHDPQTGNFISSENYFAGVRAQRETDGLADTRDPLESMTSSQLAVELARAEFQEHEVLQGHIKAVLSGRLYETFERQQQRDPSITFDREALMADSLAFKDKVLARLRAEQRKSETSSEPKSVSEESEAEVVEPAEVIDPVVSDSERVAEQSSEVVEGVAVEEDESAPAAPEDDKPANEQVADDEMEIPPAPQAGETEAKSASFDTSIFKEPQLKADKSDLDKVPAGINNQDVDGRDNKLTKAYWKLSTKLWLGADAVAAFVLRKPKEWQYLTDQEKGRKRRIITTVAAGSLAVGSVVALYLANQKSGGSVSHHLSSHPVHPHRPSQLDTLEKLLPSPSKANHTHTLDMSQLANHGAKHAAKAHHAAANSMVTHSARATGVATEPVTYHGTVASSSTVSLQPGQNPWLVSEHALHLHGHLTPHQLHQVWAYDQHMLRQDHITNEQARHLGVGTKLKLLKKKAWFA